MNRATYAGVFVATADGAEPPSLKIVQSAISTHVAKRRPRSGRVLPPAWRRLERGNDLRRYSYWRNDCITGPANRGKGGWLATSRIWVVNIRTT